MQASAAYLAAALIGVVVLFQIALALGARWGQAAWGGRHAGRLPARLRGASVGAAVVLAFLAWIVLAAAAVVSASPLPRAWLEPAAWIATGYFGLGAIVNLLSRSRVERLWGPVALLTAICCGLVAAAQARPRAADDGSQSRASPPL